MDKSLKDQLDAVFQQDRERVVTAKNKADAEQAAREQFLADFMRVRDQVIRPAMQEIVEYIADKGWACKITTRDERQNGRGGTDAASIDLSFFRGSVPSSYDLHKFPHWGVQCDKSNKKFQFHSSTIGPGHGGSGGGSGNARLDEITTEFIQADIAKYISKLMKDAAPLGSR